MFRVFFVNRYSKLQFSGVVDYTYGCGVGPPPPPNPDRIPATNIFPLNCVILGCVKVL